MVLMCHGSICSARQLHYQGQIFELSVNVPLGEVDLMALVEAFGDEHERTYGHRAGPEEPVELVNVEVVGRGIPERPRVPERLSGLDKIASSGETRNAWFGPEHGLRKAAVLSRSDLTDRRRASHHSRVRFDG